MSNKKIDSLVVQMESHLECWKQFAHYINMARAKKFELEDEAQFLEIKSVITQELELIMAALDVQTPTKEDIHTLIAQAPSLRYLSEMGEGQIRGMENQWHKIYISWQALVGQLKVAQKSEEKKGFLSGLFGKKE
ncbi:MAG TPA: hypothetical protein VM680_09995 [Verrucomicrobiae bacterium]|nr:hypothetical protein [Verrucomicrobiae bacterium]